LRHDRFGAISEGAQILERQLVVPALVMNFFHCVIGQRLPPRRREPNSRFGHQTRRGVCGVVITGQPPYPTRFGQLRPPAFLRNRLLRDLLRGADRSVEQVSGRSQTAHALHRPRKWIIWIESVELMQPGALARCDDHCLRRQLRPFDFSPDQLFRVAVSHNQKYLSLRFKIALRFTGAYLFTQGGSLNAAINGLRPDQRAGAEPERFAPTSAHPDRRYPRRKSLTNRKYFFFALMVWTGLGVD